MSKTSAPPQLQSNQTKTGSWVYILAKNWLVVFNLSYGIFVGLPFLAPVFMDIGWEGGGNALYLIYSFFCHQLPQRSLFLFGSKTMYTLQHIQSAWLDTTNPLILRQFVGNPEIGWKVAWSDRMVAMYSSIFIFTWIWYPLRRRVRNLSWWGFLLLLLPMAVDGTTHMISDIAGLGQGFRDSNAWLAALTNRAFPLSFYAGDALGSFNSWMRWISGILFGLGVVWFLFPNLDQLFSLSAAAINNQIIHVEPEPENIIT